MLGLGEQDLVAFAQVLAAPGVGDKVYGFGRAAGEDQAPDVRRAQKPSHPLAGPFVEGRGLLGQAVDTAVDVGVVHLVVLVEGVKYLPRFLGGRGVLEDSRAGPIASNRSSYPGQGEIGEPSRSLRVASGILSNTTRQHPTSMPRSDRRCEEERRAASSTGDFPQTTIPSSHTWWPAEVANASWNPLPKAAGIPLGPERSLIRPFYMPLFTEVRGR